VRRIFLDVDGVLADFHAAATELFGFPAQEAEDRLASTNSANSAAVWFFSSSLSPNSAILFSKIAEMRCKGLSGTGVCLNSDFTGFTPDHLTRAAREADSLLASAVSGGNGSGRIQDKGYNVSSDNSLPFRGTSRKKTSTDLEILLATPRAVISGKGAG